jgi:hypothetical protein
MFARMTPTAKKLLERVESWPEEDQEELVEVAQEIEARRAGIYTPTPEEERAIREGLAQLERGESLSEDDMQSFWKRCGVV